MNHLKNETVAALATLMMRYEEVIMATQRKQLAINFEQTIDEFGDSFDSFNDLYRRLKPPSAANRNIDARTPKVITILTTMKEQLKLTGRSLFEMTEQPFEAHHYRFKAYCERRRHVRSGVMKKRTRREMQPYEVRQRDKRARRDAATPADERLKRRDKSQYSVELKTQASIR